MKKSLRDKMIALRRLGNRLARDIAGNTLAIVAAAIIPLAALIGGGVDMSRAYMAQSRLQLACDAAALAGRRAMTTGVVDNTVRSEALKFFRFNFPTGESSSTTPPYGVASFTPAVADGDDSAVVVTASTTVPTTLMGIFGYNSIPVSVNCNAKQDFVNTDVMLVLDNTGSMSQDTNGVEQNSGSTSKIAGMRTAVMALYDQLAPTQALLASHGLRLRYGVVPYSVAVNVGKLLPAGYVKSDNWNYQSRVADYTTPVYVGTSGNAVADGTIETFNSGTGISSNNCNKYAANQSFTGFTPTTPTSGGGPAPTATWAYSWVPEWGWSGAPDNSGNTKSCRRYRYVTTTTYVTRYSASSSSAWTYKQVSAANGVTPYDVSNFVAGNGIILATNTGGTMVTPGTYNMQQIAAQATNASGVTNLTTNSSTPSTWDGCVEEPQTSWSLPDPNALDLALNSVPTSDPNSQWKPYWDDISYLNSGSKPTVACPKEAARLTVWDRTTLQSYVNALVANGNTYSDIGMIWGGRLLSTSGVFAADNPTTYNNMPVARYLILMTDGYINTTGTTYSGYGIEKYDHRVDGASYPGDTTDTNNHYSRFSTVCNIVKSMGVQIWVIGYGSGVTMDASLQGCASDTTKASQAADTTALIAKFQEIGKDIGALRLTK